MGYQFTFTVFTPTYNRAHTLHRVYDSLKAQTFRDFEWVIVDDGSTDTTKELVETWKQEAAFPMRYLYQTNQGKHIAVNHGVQEARGELFLIADSDDSFVPEALERFKYHWDSIPDNERERFSAVTCLCKDQFGNLVGTEFPYDVTDSNSLEIRYKHKVRGEKWGFHRTDVMKKYPFISDVTGGCVPESLVWDKIARDYQARFVNECLRIYYRGEGDSLIQRNPNQSALGGVLQHQYALNENIDFFPYAPLEFIRSAVHYIRFSFHQKRGFFGQMNTLNNMMVRVLWFVCLPLGTLVYLKDKMKYGKG